MTDRDYEFLGTRSFSVFTHYTIRDTLIESILTSYQNNISHELYTRLESSLKNINEQDLNTYIISKIMPLDFHSQKTLILNYLISLIFEPQPYNKNYNSEILYIPYMVSDVLEPPCIISGVSL